MWWLLGLVGVWWWEQRSSQGSGPTVTNAPSMAGMHFVPVDNNSHPIPGQVDPRILVCNELDIPGHAELDVAARVIDVRMGADDDGDRFGGH